MSKLLGRTKIFLKKNQIFFKKNQKKKETNIDKHKNVGGIIVYFNEPCQTEGWTQFRPHVR